MIKHVIALVLTIAMLATVGCSVGTVLEQNGDSTENRYDFRQSRWGDLINQVEWTESGKRVERRTERLLVYQARLWDIPVKIVYCFDDRKRLRAAGYMVDNPVHNVDHVAKYAVELHGMPDEISNGLLWRTNRSLVYWESVVAKTVLHSYMKGGGGLASIVGARQSKPVPTQWVGVWGYMDLDYIEKLMGDKFPFDTLSYYEERLFGALTPRANMVYRGETLPNIE